MHPKDWEEIIVKNWNEEQVLQEICKNEAQCGMLLPCHAALKNAIGKYNQAASLAKVDPIKADVRKDLDMLMEKILELPGLRAICTVTLVRLPSATSRKSKQGFVRECKRLLKALGTHVDGAVLKRMEDMAVA